MKVIGKAEDARVVGDEGGFELHIETNVGDFVFDIHSFAIQFAANVDATIGAWLREGQNARASYSPPVDPSIYDAREAYETSDPKHPDWQEAGT